MYELQRLEWLKIAEGCNECYRFVETWCWFFWDLSNLSCFETQCGKFSLVNFLELHQFIQNTIIPFCEWVEL